LARQAQQKQTLELYCFGGLEIRIEQTPITTLVSRKADALVTYLACNAHSLPREVIADLLWDDRTQSQALGNLRVVLNSLRQTLSPWVTITRQSVQLPRTEQLWADCIEFDQLVKPVFYTMPLTPAKIDALHHALQLYNGEFLAGFFLRDASQFDEWVSFERERYHIGAVRAAQILTSHYLANQDYAQGVNVAQRWVQLDSLNEKAHQMLMELLVQAGQRTAALEHYQQHANKAVAEGIELSSEFEVLYQKLSRDELASEIVGLRQPLPTGEASTTAVHHNLPSPLLPIIGRTEELKQIQERLADPSCRLLTITGMGGAGKTRLALEAAQLLAKSAKGNALFCDGIYLVRLDQVMAEQPLVSVIANAIGHTFQGPHEQTKQFLQYLRNRNILLLLDNFEHMLSHSDFLLEILHTAPAVKILVTSRLRLEFLGEWLLEIEGLPYPLPHSAVANRQPGQPFAPLPWHEYPATSLFILTAQAILPSLQPEPQRDAIVAICQMLDGLPLGIQLAASAVRTHSCAEIVASLQSNVDSLRSNMRNLPERHRSLRAVFNHSWNLLSDEEKAAFANLAVFTDGFTAVHAEAIADVSPELLVQLNTKSLIQLTEREVDDGGNADGTKQTFRRYQMHSVLHQFATEELAKDSENESLRRQRHALYFCRYAVEHGTALGSRQAADAIRLLTIELENIRAGWLYALTHYRDDLLYKMVPVLIRLYLFRGLLLDARACLKRAVEEVGGWIEVGKQQPGQQTNLLEWQCLLAHLYAYQAEVEIELGRYDNAIQAAQSSIDSAQLASNGEARALGILQWGIALNYQGLYKQAKERLQQALDLTQQHEMIQAEATAQRFLGINSFYQGDYTAGRLHHEVAIRLYREQDNLVDELRTYHSLAMLYFYTGDYLQARQHYERCRQQYEQIGDRPTLSLTLNNLGAVSSHLGDYANALHSFEEALIIRRQIGDRQREGLILANMGLLAHLMNDNRRALDYCTQALEVSLETGERDTEAYARTCLGHALLELGRVAEATANYEQAAEMRRNNGQLTQILEPLAGLARVHLRLGDAKTAATYVAEILPHLSVHTYAGIVELIRIYLTCYRVLYLQEDSRAKEILTMGYRVLQDRAAKILDTNLRKNYFENIIAHRDLMTEYETQIFA